MASDTAPLAALAAALTVNVDGHAYLSDQYTRAIWQNQITLPQH
jgi:hypothetical protein